MLEPWIIEQIRRREEEERRRDERPVLELPVDIPPWPPKRDDHRDKDERDEQDDDEPKRGVVIIGM